MTSLSPDRFGISSFLFIQVHVRVLLVVEHAYLPREAKQGTFFFFFLEKGGGITIFKS